MHSRKILISEHAHSPKYRKPLGGSKKLPHLKLETYIVTLSGMQPPD